MTLPIGRFSPAPGIWVDRTERSISITGNMEAYGSEATSAIAATIQQTINNTWTQRFPNGYSISTNITISYRSPGTDASSNRAQIEITNISGPSHVSTVPGMGREMTLNSSSRNVYTWVVAHEFGHVIGLEDRYSESIFSKIGGHFGCQRTNTVEPGYEGNMMGAHQGALANQNIGDLVSENQPSPYWINDDDHVRDWVTEHSIADIRGLSAINKLRSIRALMGGWISAEDMGAIGKICRSVNDSDEANLIRNGIDLNDFTSLGQRMQMRVFYSRMP